MKRNNLRRFKYIFCTLLVISFLSACNNDSTTSTPAKPNEKVEEQNQEVIQKEVDKGKGRIATKQLGISFVVNTKERHGYYKAFKLSQSAASITLSDINFVIQKVDNDSLSLKELPEYLVELGNDKAQKIKEKKLFDNNDLIAGLDNIYTINSIVKVNNKKFKNIKVGNISTVYFDFNIERTDFKQEDDYDIVRGYVFEFNGNKYCMSTKIKTIVDKRGKAYHSQEYIDSIMTNMQNSILSIQPYNGESFEQLDPDFNFSALFADGSIAEIDDVTYIANHPCRHGADNGGYDETNGMIHLFEGKGLKDEIFKTIGFGGEITRDEIKTIDDIMPKVIEKNPHMSEKLGILKKAEQVTIGGIDMIKSYGTRIDSKNGNWFSSWVSYSFIIEGMPCYIVYNAREGDDSVSTANHTESQLEVAWEYDEVYATAIINTLRKIDRDDAIGKISYY